jgi:hypothetical protein
VAEISPSEATNKQAVLFDATDVQQVVADTMRFKQQLWIGEEAFALLRAKKQLYTVYETAGAAATAASVASSSVVAGTFFAPTGVAAALGLATAATPVGWVVAAALVAGGGYYGVTRWFSDRTGAFVDTIPKYINTPIDVLGAAIVELLGSLALRVAVIDGHLAPEERACIEEHLVKDWGFDPTYVIRALDVMISRTDQTRVKAMTRDLVQFQSGNPDCNAPAMQAELLKFLRELIAIDGVVDEREELALEAIERVIEDENRLTLSKMGEGLIGVSKLASIAAGEAVSRVGNGAKSLAGAISHRLSEAASGLSGGSKS